MTAMKFIFAAIPLCLLLIAPSARARTIVLEPGQSYGSGETTIVCGAGGERDVPLTRTECQYWDDFDKRCLYQRKSIIHGRAECVEECQHWDEFNKECRFATACVFHAGQRRFVRTVCEEFDTFSATCVRTRQEVLNTTRKQR
ncbi:MAG: hypothetical protein ACOY8P_02610 [Thermodesulfobacteriota bacterium]